MGTVVGSNERFYNLPKFQVVLRSRALPKIVSQVLQLSFIYCFECNVNIHMSKMSSKYVKLVEIIWN